MANEKIVIVDDDPDIIELMKMILVRSGYSVYSAESGENGIKLINEIHPDLVILDVNMPDFSGFEVLEILRKQSSTFFLPVIMLTANTKIQDKIKGIRSGADDYITKPFDPFELEARVFGMLSRSKKQISASPLTHLPGSIVAEEKIKKIIEEKKLFAVGYLDIDNFKAYNDLYGFAKGDEVIIKTGQIIVEKIKNFGKENDLVCHIGGDDFIYISVPDCIEKISQEIINEFDGCIYNFYNEEDKKNKFIISHDRRGNVLKFPLMTISIGIVTNEKREITHFAKVAEITAEVKKVAKSMPGSHYFKDRRAS